MTADAINIRTILNESRFTAFHWLVFGMCFFIVLLDGFDTSAIGYVAPALVSEWGIARPDLAPVLSAALFGLAFGALAAGPLADSFGRKRIMIGAVLIFALASFASARAGDVNALTIWRFVTGVGLGAAMPNAVTMMSEYCPDRLRALITNAMFCGFPLGASLGGFVAAWMIPQWGWRSVLLLGGTAPFLLCLILIWKMPESIRYLVAREGDPDKITAILRRFAPAGARAKAFFLDEPGRVAKAGPALIVSKPYLVGSLMLWIAYFMGLVIFYALINWMPVLLKDAGLDPRTATLIAALFPLGGIGAIASGWLMDHYNANKVLAVFYLLTAAAVYAIGQAAGSSGLLAFIVFLGGALMNTAQSSLPALAAQFYPTAGRATGVAFMLGVGRFGGIAGSFLVAELTRRQVDFSGIFAIVAIAGVIATIALIVKYFAHPEAPAGAGSDVLMSH
ncbi:MFS transporter [Methylovirgula sp. 4M-Z18]|uniref:MFS transporter n=1 Tax=Methylovirgula sp. 4M-Z18 TaxID=2293567 RepID=UPI000E2EA071|nr:MFS transporter [Methylovirgula sp. 4M-Z18]RFB79453.1 MFS transporter [Methylovirgula sp. 4M-Z18]